MTHPDHIHPLARRLRLNSLALAVCDLSAMTRWYEQVLGFTVAERGRFAAVDADCVLLDGAGTRLELVSRPSTAHIPVDRTMPPGHLGILGWKALVLDADDLIATTAVLTGHGVDTVWANHPVSTELYSTMIRDPEGNLIHIFGPLRKHEASQTNAG
jgi:glyoxylase I family protein